MDYSFRALLQILSGKDYSEDHRTSDERIFINTAKLLSYFCGSLLLLVLGAQSDLTFTPLTIIVFILGSILTGFVFLLVCQLISTVLLKSHHALLRLLPIIPPILVLIWCYFNLYS